ncbi:hypothetical protein M8J77_010774 [Diaphorina citri]|nr:hypothetical protein M8J77_010774 [Diaphorina citri]
MSRFRPPILSRFSWSEPNIIIESNELERLQVDLLEGYCDPRDSKAYSNPGDTPDVKIYTSPDGDYSHPYLISPLLPSNLSGAVVGAVDFGSGGWWFESKSSHKI